MSSILFTSLQLLVVDNLFIFYFIFRIIYFLYLFFYWLVCVFLLILRSSLYIWGINTMS